MKNFPSLLLLFFSDVQVNANRRSDAERAKHPDSLGLNQALYTFFFQAQLRLLC
jgi:hypothetical protein